MISAQLRDDIVGISSHFGWVTQCLKFIEEVFEAGLELIHCFFQGKPIRRQHLVEELADVYVVLMQMPILLDSLYKKPQHFELVDGSLRCITYEELFWRTVHLKINRTKNRIKDGYYEKGKQE